MADEGTVWRTRAKATLTDTEKAALRARAEERALDPAIFETEEPFFWRATASSGALDSYYTKMDSDTLTNFAADAEAGVGFQNSHNTRDLGIGRSLFGRVRGPASAKVFDADFYTLPGLSAAGLSSDAFIRGVRAGIYADVSVGFSGGRFECSICGGDPTDWFGDCQHYPGVEYETKTNGRAKREVAFAWIRGARLNEVSVVYDGATPGAGIVAVEKARIDAERGRLKPAAARLLEQRYRLKLPGTERVVALGGIGMQDRTDANPAEPVVTQVVEPEIPEAEAVSEETVIADGVPPVAEPTDPAAPAEDPLAGERGRLASHGITLGRDAVAAVRALGDEVLRLRPLADAGKRYRTDLIDETLAEAVRAHGAEFAAEQTRADLDLMPLDSIKRWRDTWKATGDKRFPGGRTTTEPDAENGARAADRQPVPEGVID